ncbi:MAG: hypothetical protein AAF266_02840 [Planctomycetota bacterium]
MTVHDRLDTTNGAATDSTSRPPPARDHQLSPGLLGGGDDKTDLVREGDYAEG